MRARAQRPSTARPRSGHRAHRPEATRATGESPALAQQRVYSLSRPATAAPARALRSRQALRWVSRSRRARGPRGPGGGGGGAGKPEGPGRAGAAHCGDSRTGGPSAPRTGRRAHPALGAGSVAAATTRLVPTSALFPRTPSGRFHPPPPHPPATRCSWRTPLAGTPAAGSRSRPAAPTPGARDARARLLGGGGQGSGWSQMAWGFPGIEIAAGSGPLKLLKGRDVKGRVRAHPGTSPTATPAPTRAEL